MAYHIWSTVTVAPLIHLNTIFDLISSNKQEFSNLGEFVI